jgi:glycosyltransferase involved in cell wall biosynthesis
MTFQAGHIVASLASRRGGPSRSVLALARAQARPGSTVAVATLGPAEGVAPTVPNLHLEWAHPGWPQRLAVSPDLDRFLRNQRFEALHHHGLWLRPLHYAFQQARRHHVPLIISPRGMMSEWAWARHRHRKAIAHRLVHPGALTHATGWHATSGAEADEIRARGFRQPICVAPNGVELPSDEQRRIAREHWSDRIPSAATRPLALFHSRLHSKKRIIELIDLWLSHAPVDWQLLVIGLPDEFSVLDLEQYVLRSRGQGRVLVFDGQFQPPPYAIASLFILPSHSENFGLAIAEALAAGVPALVTDTTPWSGLNEHGAGWWVPWTEFGPTLRAALTEDLRSLQARGEAGRRWMGRSFVWDEYARRLLDFYLSVSPVR